MNAAVTGWCVVGGLFFLAVLYRAWKASREGEFGSVRQFKRWGRELASDGLRVRAGVRW